MFSDRHLGRTRAPLRPETRPAAPCYRILRLARKPPADPWAGLDCFESRRPTRSIKVAKRFARGPRLRSRVPLSQRQLNAFLAQKYLSEPLMIS